MYFQQNAFIEIQAIEHRNMGTRLRPPSSFEAHNAIFFTFIKATGIVQLAAKVTLLVATNVTTAGATETRDKIQTTRPEASNGFAQNAEQQTDPDNEIATSASGIPTAEGAHEGAVGALEDGMGAAAAAPVEEVVAPGETAMVVVDKVEVLATIPIRWRISKNCLLFCTKARTR